MSRRREAFSALGARVPSQLWLLNHRFSLGSSGSLESPGLQAQGPGADPSWAPSAGVPGWMLPNKWAGLGMGNLDQQRLVCRVAQFGALRPYQVLVSREPAPPATLRGRQQKGLGSDARGHVLA